MFTPHSGGSLRHSSCSSIQRVRLVAWLSRRANIQSVFNNCVKRRREWFEEAKARGGKTLYAFAPGAPGNLQAAWIRGDRFELHRLVGAPGVDAEHYRRRCVYEAQRCKMTPAKHEIETQKSKPKQGSC